MTTAGLVATWFLTFLGARVAGQITLGTEHWTQVLVPLDQSASNAMTSRFGLGMNTTTTYFNTNVELAFATSDFKRS